MKRTLLGVAALTAAALISISTRAWAQDAQAMAKAAVDTVCANKDVVIYVIGGFLASFGLSFFGGAAERIKQMPPWLVSLLKLVGGDVLGAFLKKAAPVFLLAAVLDLAACAAGQIAAVQSDIQTVNANLSTILADANQDVATFAADDLPGICSFVGTLNGDFSTAAAISGTVQAQAAAEAAVYQAIQNTACGPGLQVANVEQAVVQAKTAAQQIQAAIKATQ